MTLSNANHVLQALDCTSELCLSNFDHLYFTKQTFVDKKN